MKWDRIDDYHLKSGDWTIARYQVWGQWIYVLWHKAKWMGKFQSADEAKIYAKSQQEQGNGAKNE